jgi:hypothetical protein
MAIGRPDFFSQPITLRYGSRLGRFQGTLSALPGGSDTVTEVFAGVVRKLLLWFYTDTPDKTGDAFSIIVDGVTFLLCTFQPAPAAERADYVGTLLQPVYIDYIANEFAFLFEQPTTVLGEFSLSVSADGASAGLDCRYIGWYDEIEAAP